MSLKLKIENRGVVFATLLLSLAFVVQGTPLPESSSSSAPASPAAAAAPSAFPKEGTRLLALFPLGNDAHILTSLLAGNADDRDTVSHFEDLLRKKDKNQIPDSDGKLEDTRFLAILQGATGQNGKIPIVGAILDGGKDGKGLQISNLPLVGGLVNKKAGSVPDSDGGSADRLGGLTGKKKSGGNLGGLVGGLPIIGSLPLIDGLLGGSDGKGGKGKKLAVFTNIPLVGDLVGGLSGKKDERQDSVVDDFGNVTPVDHNERRYNNGDRSGASASPSAGAAPAADASASSSSSPASSPAASSSA